MPHQDPYMYAPRRSSSVSTLFKCLTVVTVSAMLCGAGLVVGTVSRLDSRLGSVIDLAKGAVTNLPQFIRDLPPVLSVAVNDRRDPGYAHQVEVRATAVSAMRDGLNRAVLEISNRGDEVISVLALRLVCLDAQGRAVCERTVYGATPFAADDEWRGPLFPGATRRIPVVFYSGRSAAVESVESELAELRLWTPQSLETAARAS